jgi:hypothetical protein
MKATYRYPDLLAHAEPRDIELKLRLLLLKLPLLLLLVPRRDDDEVVVGHFGSMGRWIQDRGSDRGRGDR